MGIWHSFSDFVTYRVFLGLVCGLLEKNKTNIANECN